MGERVKCAECVKSTGNTENPKVPAFANNHGNFFSVNVVNAKSAIDVYLGERSDVEDRFTNKKA